MACFTLPDSPMKAGFLTEEERRFVANRLQTETGTGKGRVTNDDRIQPKYVWAALREWKIWMAVWVFWGNSISVYGYVEISPIASNHSRLPDLHIPFPLLYWSLATAPRTLHVLGPIRKQTDALTLAATAHYPHLCSSHDYRHRYCCVV
jgi:hypothetical protein